jgi:hypothetical protein
MKALISLMLVTSIVGAQEVRAPQRGEERREPNRVERPEPVRVQPQPESPRQEQPPRRPEPRPEPPVDRPPMGRPNNGGVVILDPWVRTRDCWNCRNPWITMQMDINRRQQMNRPRPPRPPRVEMARQRWESLTPKQQKQLIEARKDFREKVQKILNNP